MFREVKAKFFKSGVVFAAMAGAGLLVSGSVTEAKQTFKDLSDFHFILSTGILQGMISKEMCSCRYVVGLPMKDCQERSSLPAVTFSIVTVMDDVVKKTVTVYPAVPLSSVPAMAIFDHVHPRKGCRLVYGMKDALDRRQ
jgi:hypothetical protein